MGGYLSSKKAHAFFFLFAVIAIIIILFFSLVVRSTGLFTNNILFLFDNGRDLLFVRKIIIDHKFLLIGPSSGGLQGYFHGVLWYYLLTIPFVIGKGNPAVFTGFMIVISTLATLFVFFVLKRLVGFFPALFGFVIFSFGAFSVATAKFIWNPYPIVWIMPVYFLCLYLFVKKKPFSLVFILFLTALVIHLEAIYGICLLPTALIVLGAQILRKEPIKRKLFAIVLAIAAFFLPMIPTLIFDLRHHFLITSSLLHAFQSGGNTVTHNGRDAVSSLAERFLLRSQDFFTYTLNVITPNIYLNLSLFVLAVISTIKLIKKKDNANIFLIALTSCTLIAPFVFFLFLKYSVWSYYWIGNAPLYGVALVYTVSLGLKGFKKGFMTGAILISLLAFFLFSPWTHFATFKDGEIGKGTQNLATELSVVDMIEKDSSNQPFAVYVQTPPVYDYVYRYLFLWKGTTLYHKFPQNQKQPLTYVIIEGTDTDKDGKFFKDHTLHITDSPTKTFTYIDGPKVEEYTTLPTEVPVDQNYFPSL